LVVERLRYAPVGWTKTFAFTDDDKFRALNAIDNWTLLSKVNLDPLFSDFFRGKYPGKLSASYLDKPFMVDRSIIRLTRGYWNPS
jgi:hypothetical protein